MEFLKENKPTPRRKYLKWILGSAAGISLAGLLSFKGKAKTVKMLTQDGKLVEVPLKNLPKKMRKATRTEMQTWVWKHNT